MKKLFYLGLVVLSLTACHEDEGVKVDFSSETLVFGHYYGMCVGEQCVEIFKISNGELLEDTKDLYPGAQPYEGRFEKKSQALYEQVKHLPAHIPAQLLQEENGVIGQPDIADGGGIYLELVHDRKIRYFFIDKSRHKVPAYLHPFLDEVEASIAKLK